MTGKFTTDSYGGVIHPFEMEDPDLPFGCRVLIRYRTEDGEHVWIVRDARGQIYRWLEDEGGPEWSWRVSQV